MADINLLPVEERAHERFAPLFKRLSIASVAVLAITAIFTIATLGFFTSLVAKRTQLVADIEASASQINNLKATEELAVVVKEKAQVAQKILAGRTNHRELLDKLARIVPVGVYFTDIKFSAEKVIFSGRARTSADVAGLVSSLLSSEGSQIVSGVTVDSLTSDDAGVYTFAITAQIVK